MEHVNRQPLALTREERELASLYDQFRSQNQEDEESLNFKEYWAIIVRHKFTILLFTAIALVGTAIATSLQTPIYRSTVKLQIERNAPQIINFQGNATPVGIDYSYDFYKTQYQLLRSKALAKRIVEQLGLESSSQFQAKEKPSFFRDIKNFFLGNDESSSSRTAKPTSSESLAYLLLANLSVEPIKDSQLINISFDSPNPELAAKVVNTLAKSFIDMSMERRFENVSYAKTFLNDRIKQVRANLEESEKKLVEYARDREVVNLDSKKTLLMQKLDALNQRMTEVESNRIRAQSMFQEMKKSGIQSFPQASENELIQTYKEKLLELETEYENKLSVFKPAYPEMRQLKRQITDLKQKISEEIGNLQAQVRADYQAAAREQTLLRKRMAEIKEQILNLQLKGTDYLVLKRDVETNRQLYDGLLQRIKEVGVAGGIDSNNISIIDRGEVPGAAYKPNMMHNLKLALIVGLIGGIGLAWLFEYLDDTIKSPADVEKITALASLGVVPQIAVDPDTTSVALKTYEDPKSAIAEAYRSCRTALSFSSSSGTPPIIHIASAIASEGKTTTAISMALTYVQSGSNVLLIDCDLRNPSIHNELGLSNGIGLTNYLVGGSKPSEIVQKSHIDGLYVLTSGPLPPNPAELLDSDRMRQFLEAAAERFDVVIVDGPPVLGLADALILANIAKATVMVIDAGVTRAGTLKGAVQRLRQARAHLLGAILVKYGQGSSGYGYDYHYHYNYYSYEAEDADEHPRLAS